MPIIANPWDFLKSFTDARIALGRAGNSIPTAELLQFQLAHAKAKDAVYSQLDNTSIQSQLSALNLESTWLHSKAKNRGEYLKRPDLGRRLAAESIMLLENHRVGPNSVFDIAICIVDGLSAQAIETNSIALLQFFLPLSAKEAWTLAPIAIVNHGRVAIGDEIAHLLRAEIVVVMIGERPGLSSPDSMGIYLTYKPMPGFTDESRNCISNIRPRGLAYDTAAAILFAHIKAAKALQLSGVHLKLDSLLINHKQSLNFER